MAIQKYEFSEITPMIKEMFPVKPCTEIYCRMNMNALRGYYNYSMGLGAGNKYALNRFKKFVRGGGNGDDDLDFLSESQYLYYNTDKKEY
jgi:hypothetical protein